MRILVPLFSLSLGLAVAQTPPATTTPSPAATPLRAPSSTATPAPTLPTPTLLRFAAASPELPSADVYIDGKKVLGALAYTHVTPYDELPFGKHTVLVRRHGETTTALVGKVLNLSGGRYTLALLTLGKTLKLGVFILPEGTGAAGNTRMSFFNFAQDAGKVDLLEPDYKNARVKAALSFDKAATRTFAPLPLRLNVVSSGKIDPALAQVARFVPLPEHAYSVFVLGHSGGSGFQAVQVEDRLERGSLSAKP